MELALRGRIGVPKESLTFRRSNTPLVDRPVEVRSTKHTGEVLLDEALRLMAPSSPTSISSWVDLLSGTLSFLSLHPLSPFPLLTDPSPSSPSLISPGETWNLSKVGLQLKQVRERLAKGLVEKGVLRTERRSFLIFDMATHPVQDGRARNEIISKVQAQVLGQTAASTPMGGPPTSETLAPDARLRDALMVSACYAANVLENALVNQDFSERERAFEGADALLGEYGVWPCSQSSIQEAEEAGLPKECLEVACGVIAVFAKMDSVL